MKAKQGIKVEQLAAGFERGIRALDELRVMQLGDGLRLQGAQNRVQAREYVRLERKYGKDHPRTLNVAAKIELGKEHMQAISIVHATASALRPDPENGWAVDGFVRNSKGDPVSGVTVAAYDRQERWCEELGYACTDEDGYFSIVVEKISEKLLRPIFMRASKGKKLLVSNEVRLTPAPKSSDRVEIIIGDISGKGDCTSPAGSKDEASPPEQPVCRKETTAAPVKETKDAATTMASEPTDEQKPKTMKDTAQKFKESGKRTPVGGKQKVPPQKGSK